LSYTHQPHILRLVDSRIQNLEKVAFWVVLFALLIGFFWLLKPFYGIILLSLVLALACEPLFQGLLKLFRGRRHPAAFLCLVLFAIFLALPSGVLVSLITDQVLKVAHGFSGHIHNHTFQNLLVGWLPPQLEAWRQSLGFEIDIISLLKEAAQNSAQYLYQFSPKVVSKTATFFLGGLFTVILTYFLLVDGPRLYHEILDLSPLKNTYEKTLAKEIRLTLRACIYGYILTALVQGILAGIGFWIAGIDIALLLGLATFIMAFVPIVGTGSVWVPVFIYLLISGQWGMATFLFIYGFFVISGIDNVLKPILIQGKTNIHPVLLFLAIFGGLKLWGPIGILAGPTLVAVLLATLRIYRQDFHTR